MKKKFIKTFAFISFLFVILSCSEDRITNTENSLNEAIASRAVDDYVEELPVTDTPEMMDFVEHMEDIFGRGTLVTEDGAIYVDASQIPITTRIYYNRINGILKAVMITGRNISVPSGVKYAIEKEKMKIVNNNSIQYQLQGFTSSMHGGIEWPDMDNVEAEVVLDHNGDTLMMCPPLPFNIYYSKRQEVNVPTLEKEPFNINITISSRL
ncbi:MAG: hypothetical protein IKW32_03375 [Bacteroidaceae bacterium]|nr:hypothetical protein [Bacteroidaceae bacterium]